MTKIDNLTLLSGESILCDGKFSVKQPKISDIAKIGELNFYNCLGAFFISINNIKDEQIKNKYKDLNKIAFLAIIIATNIDFLKSINTILKCTLDNYVLSINPDTFQLELIRNINEKIEVILITDEIWNELCNIFIQIFCLPSNQNIVEENKNSKLSEIKAKLAAGRAKAQEIKNKKENVKNTEGLLDNYISVVSIGAHIPLTTIVKEYTIYQLIDQVKRLNKSEEYDLSVRAAMFGSDKPIVSWTDKLD